MNIHFPFSLPRAIEGGGSSFLKKTAGAVDNHDEVRELEQEGASFFSLSLSFPPQQVPLWVSPWLAMFFKQILMFLFGFLLILLCFAV